MAFSISVTAFCWTTRPSLLRALFFSTLVLTVAYFESLVQTPTHPCDTIHTRCRSSLDYSSEPAHSFHVLFVPAVAPSWIAHPSLHAISVPFQHPPQSPFGLFIRTCAPFSCTLRTRRSSFLDCSSKPTRHFRALSAPTAVSLWIVHPHLRALFMYSPYPP